MAAAPLSSRIIRKSLWNFHAANIEWSVFSSVTVGALYTGMLLALDFTQVQIALVMSVPALTQVAQVAGAALQRRRFNRRRFWMSLQGVFLGVYAFIPVLVAAWPALPEGLGFALFITALFAANIFYQLQRPSQLAWINDVVPERETSVFWNKMTARFTVAAVVSGFVFSAAVDEIGRENRLTYVMTLAVGLLAAAYSLRTNARVPDPDPEPDPAAPRRIWRDLRDVMRSGRLRQLTFIFSVLTVGNWTCCAFIWVHLKDTMGFTMTETQALGAVSCAVAFGASKVFGIVGRRYGRKPVLMICVLVKAVEFALWGLLRPGDHWLDAAVRGVTERWLGEWAQLAPGFAGALPIFILGGFNNVGISSMQNAYMRSLGARESQAVSIGLFLAFTGVVAGVMSVLSGPLYNLVESAGVGVGGAAGLTPFNVLALCGAFVYLLAAACVKFMREDGAAPTRQVVRMLLANNPVRAAWQAQTLASALTESSRMGAQAKARGGLVEDEIVRDLRSFSSLVRDGAMRNLSSLGAGMDEAAAAELVGVLAAPELGLQVEAAKALGRARSRAALPHLAALFDSPHPNVAAAAISAAGLIGDKSVLPDLRRALESDDLGGVEKAYAAEALSRISDHSDARAVFAAFTQNTNPVIVNQCLVALCRLMEDGPHVYKLFEGELRKPGSLAAELLESIAKRWRGVDLDTAIEDLDGGRHRVIAEAVIVPELAFCVPLECPDGMARADFLKSQFLENGGFREPLLDGADYAAVALWLQLRLWSYIEYGEDESQGRFILLSILFICDRLGKRLDPRHPRARHAVMQTAPLL